MESCIDIDKLRIAKLSNENIGDLAIFDCSGNWKPTTDEELGIKEDENDINDFIRNDAYNQQNMGLSTTYLFYYGDKVASFVTVLADSIKLSNREKTRSELPYKEVSAIKIGRLGTDCEFAENGIGSKVIVFVKTLAYNLNLGKDVYGEEIGTNLGVRYVTLDSYSHNVEYYKRREFVINASADYQERTNISMRCDLF